MKRVALLVAGLLMLVLSLIALTSKGAREQSVFPNPFDSRFWQHWGDGQAELAGYDLVFPRYGALCKGVAVTIFVTEPFSNQARVKADAGKHSKGDEFQVMKLNLVRDFPTGVYDYNLMTSTFIALQPTSGLLAGESAKVSFSAQEWCGHVYGQLVFREMAIDQTLHSYFDGEGDQTRKLSNATGGISEDALFHWARGLAEPFLQPGTSTRRPLLVSLTTSRVQHVPVSWKEATFSRSARSETITVPAGEFAGAELRTVTVTDGPTWTFWIEKELPHRILRWRSSSGEEASLIRSERMPYWKMNGAQFEGFVSKLGLNRRPPRTP